MYSSIVAYTKPDLKARREELQSEFDKSLRKEKQCFAEKDYKKMDFFRLKKIRTLGKIDFIDEMLGRKL